MWQLLPIDLIHYILNFVSPNDFINVCRFIGKIKGKMSQQEQAKSIKYLWKRVVSDLKQDLLIAFPGLGKYAPLSVYRKYLNVDFYFDTPTQANPLNIRLIFVGCILDITFYEQQDGIDDELYASIIEFSFETTSMEISCIWDSGHKFRIKLKATDWTESNSNTESCTMKFIADSYNFHDVCRPVPRFATFNMFKDEIIEIINKFAIHI